MKTLPYFKWYPADAETDGAYASMSLEERGLYHTCLNMCWMNSGLPADEGELCRLLRVPPEEFARAWPRVSRCFTTHDGVLLNRRQEEEREEAKSKSEHLKRTGNNNAKRRSNADETPKNADETPMKRNCVLRAYESESVSASSSKGGYGGESWKGDEQFARFAADYLATGASLIDADFAEAWQFCWRTLDFEQKLTRMAGLASHAAEYAENPRFVPKPLKFLQTEWERPVRPPPAGTGQMTGADRVKALALKNLATRGRIL